MARSARVIVIAAEQEHLADTERFLNSVGYAVEAYSNPASLLNSSVPDEEPTCMVLDLHLAEMDGVEARERLARCGHDHPVVFVTSRGADVPASVDAMKRGAVDVLLKGCNRGQMLDAIERSLQMAVSERAQRDARQHARARLDRLTRRERQVCKYLMEGLLNKQIAAVLGIAESTVKVHRSRLMEKLGLASLISLMRLLDQSGVTEIWYDESADEPRLRCSSAFASPAVQ